MIIFEEVKNDKRRNVKRDRKTGAFLPDYKPAFNLRKEKDLTQRELAELINTTQSCIARLESGKYNPSLRFLQKIADACDKKIEIRFIAKTCQIIKSW